MTATCSKPETLPNPPSGIILNAHVRWDSIGKSWTLIHPDTGEIGERFTSGTLTNAEFISDEPPLTEGRVRLSSGIVSGNLSIYEELPADPEGMHSKKLVTYDREKEKYVERSTGETQLCAPHLALHPNGSMIACFPITAAA